MSENESCPTCTKPEEHKAHMCQLKQEGRIEEIDRHSAKPKFDGLAKVRPLCNVLN